MNTDIASSMENFYKSLSIMGQGMVGVFLVIVIIFFLIIGLQKIFPETK